MVFFSTLADLLLAPVQIAIYALFVASHGVTLQASAHQATTHADISVQVWATAPVARCRRLDPGFGLLAAATQQVTGVKLEKQAQAAPNAGGPKHQPYALIFGSFGGGVLWELAFLWLGRRRLA